MRNLLKALLTTGGGTIVSQILSLIVNKILAHAIGAPGVGFYSLCRQVHESAVGIAGIGAGGLVQGLAGRDGAARRRLFRAAVFLSACGAVAIGAILLLVPGKVAQGLFDRADAVTVIAVMLCAATVVLGIVFAMLGAIVNAERAIGMLALMGIVGTLAAAVVAWPVAAQASQYPYVLMALIGLPLLVQIGFALVVLRRLGWRSAQFTDKADRPGATEFRYFGGFFVFNLTLGAIGTATILYVRSSVVHIGGLEAAGIFAAAWGIGMQSMSLILSSFGTYVLPTVAASDAVQRRKALQDAATLVLALCLPLLTILIVCKPLVLRMLFTADFLPAVGLLQWLLLGNYLKALSWVMGIPFLALADLRRYFILEASWYAALAGGTAIALEAGDWLSGIGMAYVGAYLLYLLCAAVMAKRRFDFHLAFRSLSIFVLGAGVLALAAALTWNDVTMRWPVAFALPVLAVVVAGFGLTPQQRLRARQLAARLVHR